MAEKGCQKEPKIEPHLKNTVFKFERDFFYIEIDLESHILALCDSHEISLSNIYLGDNSCGAVISLSTTSL